MATGEKILIVNLTRLGDLLQTSPVIQGLKEARPDCQITLLAEQNFADVTEGIPGLDRIYRLNLDRLGNQLLEGGSKLVTGYSYVEQVIEELRHEKFDMGLNFSSSRMTAVFMGLLRIPDLRGWSMTKDGFRVIAHPWSRLFASMCLNRRFAVYNLVDYYLRMAGLDPWGGGMTYHINEEAQTSARSLLEQGGWASGQPMVAVQLGASRSARCWPPESFVELGKRISDELGCRLALVGGKLDRELAETVKSALGEAAINLCGRTSIAELGAVLRCCNALVTGDTGPMHMAVAVGVPVIGLFFGPASPFDTGPYSRDNVVLHAQVPCAPCNHNVSCLRPFCREEITPAMVIEALRWRLAEDWGALSSEANNWGNVRVFRTGFDAQGFYCCTPLRRQAGGGDELVRQAYRQMWLAGLDDRLQLVGAKADQEQEVGRREGEFVSAFLRLAELAREGSNVGRLLVAEASSIRPSIANCEELAERLEKIDGDIESLGGIVPATAPLAQMFRFAKENLEGEELRPLAEQTCRLYGHLTCQSATMARLLRQREGEDRSAVAGRCRETAGSQQEPALESGAGV